MKSLLCGALSLAVTFTAGTPSRCADKSKLAWDSTKVLDVKKEMETLEASFPGPPTKGNYEERAEKVDELLGKRLSHQEMSDLAATCGTLPLDEDKWSRFDRALILEMTWVFLSTGDRDSLVTLFSTRFPSTYHFTDIEGLLVLHGGKIKDSVLVLGDAYSRCRAPEVRSVIAQAVRRGFRGSGIRGKDDAEFVKNAMSWYERERGNLVANLEYASNYLDSSFGPDRYMEHPLFKNKSSGPANVERQ